MRIEFSETVPLPVGEVYPYFRSPRDWPRLYGSYGQVEDRGDGWFAVPLRSFPFPLVAKVVEDRPGSLVRWILGGFWGGEGRIEFLEVPGGTAVRGFEVVRTPWLGPLACLVERFLLAPRFRRIWELGWRRLRSGWRRPSDESA